MKRNHRFTLFFALQIVSVQLATAEPAVISPNEIVEKNDLVYQVGSNEPFTGRVISTRYDGSKAYEEPYVNGKLYGARTEWDRLGNRISETNYIDGAMTGPETHWYLSGQVMAITHYVKGARHGLSTRWCENGQKRFEWSYANNMKNGMQSTWYLSGQKYSEYFYADGRRSIRLTKWHKNGQMKIHVDADQNRQVITATYWHENGQKQCEGVRARVEPPRKTAWDKYGNVLELEEKDFIAHCNSSLGPDLRRPGQVDGADTRGDLNAMSYYSTIGNATTASELELSASQRADMVFRANEAVECGLPSEMIR
jgi:antitoxin component YwqK of YwqJK toxin-antitoxin module